LNDTLSDIKDKKYKTDTVLKTPTLDNVKWLIDSKKQLYDTRLSDLERDERNRAVFASFEEQKMMLNKRK
jgi:hypothetical protein